MALASLGGPPEILSPRNSNASLSTGCMREPRTAAKAAATLCGAAAPADAGVLLAYYLTHCGVAMWNSGSPSNSDIASSI